MSGEQKEYISLHLELLKKALKDEGLCFAFWLIRKILISLHLQL